MHVKPTKEFVAFVQASVQSDAERKHRGPGDIFASNLWAAARLDWYLQTGQFKRLVDDGGLPKVEAEAYKVLIEIAQKIRVADGVSTASYEDYFKRFPANT